MSATIGGPRTETREGVVVAPFQWRPVLAVSLALSALLLVLAGEYGYYMDELYFRVAGAHPAWGYVDQPPLVPLLAKAQIALFGDTPFAVRVVPALLAGLSVWVAAHIARELGGGGRAQVLAAFAAAGTLATLSAGHVLHPTAVDHVVWVALCWLLVRLLRTRDSRLWLAIGAVVGVGLLAKYLVVLLVVGLAAGLLGAGPRHVPRDRFLAAGAGIGAVIALPVLIWQATHGWPQLSMASDLSEPLGVGSAVSFLVGQVLMIGPFLTPLWVAGLVALFRRPQWRDYRALAVAYVAIAVVLVLVGGFGRYTEGLLTALTAAGCVPAADWLSTLPRRIVLAVAVVANAALAAVMCLPVLPVSAYAEDSPLAGLGEAQLGQTGWEELTTQVAAVYGTLPPAERAHAVVYGQNYAEAGAVDRFGPARGLPPAYSALNSYYDFGHPGDDKTVVIAVGVDPDAFAPHFTRCERAATLHFALPHLEAGQQVLLCHDPVESWDRLWPRLRWVGTF
ncbi:glycosyltransferase family 39 protein [Actinokineospora sp. NBRC 105648]|uniref:ArnT family glycosyltransferase n=1 Tax=Actinokineospora sp. NBRC 105648 TaxID=3032206 RepID=UPI002552F194|nr:glycosyltransferase family 39 protein [Actinokineospora sp. NBRC 105648]